MKTTTKGDINSFSKEQLKKKIEKAIMFIEKGSDYKAIYFDDMGLGIHVCEHYVLLSRPFNDIVYRRVTGRGYDAPCQYLDAVVDIANKHRDDMQIKDASGNPAYSFRKLYGLKKLEDYERTLLDLFKMFVYNITDPIYAIGNTSFDIINMLTSYYSVLAKNNVLLDAHDKDMNRNDFFNSYISLFRNISLGCKIADEKVEALKEKIAKAELDAYETIKKSATDMGGELLDEKALNKSNESEDEAFKAMAADDESKAEAAESIKSNETKTDSNDNQAK